ncbi:MAG: hypothetical protein LBG19_00185 [Prevotellaceae bacterium]|jgi:hypothetical protein|nr:hypothetical protein [Prevotellaceae bacterium]
MIKEAEGRRNYDSAEKLYRRLEKLEDARDEKNDTSFEDVLEELSEYLYNRKNNSRELKKRIVPKNFILGI